MTPYRDGKKLDDVIAPDRRRQRAILMIAGGMIGGAVLIEGLRFWLDDGTKPKLESLPGPVVLHAPPLPGPLSKEELAVVVSRNKADLRDRCFRADLPSATVYIDVVVGKNGDVIHTGYEGTDARVTECVDREVRQWRFPAHSEDSATARIPFYFERT